MDLHSLNCDKRDAVGIGRASWWRLAFRKLIDDPSGLSRRPLTGAIGTLTIRGAETTLAGPS